VEQHGNNQRQIVTAIIPARFSSTRLPGKLLLSLAGKPLILHTVEQAKLARNVSRVIVATDSEKILKVVEASGNEAVLTSANHQSGSDRIAEVAANLPENSIIVNVQGDEPVISPRTIEKAVEAILADDAADITTTCEKIEDWRDVLSPDVVKVVTDNNNFALYFSRSPIPFPRERVQRNKTLENALRNEPELLGLFRKHTGLYVYRREFLLKFTKLPQTRLEKIEMLEQLRALENGAGIKVIETEESSIGVDTKEDFERVKEIIERKITFREAKISDISQIARVHVESWQKSYAGIVPQKFLDDMTAEKRAKAFEDGAAEKSFYGMFVAENWRKEIVGFADFGESQRRKEFDAELYAIYFAPEFQRKGIGAELFKLCQKEIIAGGASSMCLETLEKSPYRKFYEKLGGEIVGEDSRNFAGIPHKTLIYGWKNLGENYS
jgi:3-deoxy-manno-octulosonate cytidylyltransferase (CMP-KDO synthetase)